MNPFDSGFGPDPETRKRMLPSVTDVVRDLAKTISADPAVLFKAARSVVAEELKKVKQGFEAAPLEILVKRARNQLEREGSATVSPSEPTPPPMPVFPARPAAAAPSPPRPPASVRPSTTDDPFEDPTTRADLNWEKDLPIQPEDAPFRSAILPIPSKSRGPAGIAAPALPAAEPRPAPSASVVPPPPSGPSRPPGSGSPGAVPLEERPTESLKPLPRPAVAAGPSVPLTPPRDPDPWADEPAESSPASPRAAFERFLRSPSTPGSPAVPAVSPVSGELREPQAAPDAPDLHAAFKPREPAVKSMSEMPPLAELVEKTEPAVEEFHFKAAEADPAPPTRSAGRGWLVAVALVLVIGAGLAWAVREYVFRNETVKAAAPVAVRKPEAPPAAPATSTAPPPVAAKPKASAKSPSAPAPKTASAAPALAKGRAALLLTPDWAGKPAVYVIHFSSTKDRESAAKEAVKIAAALGAPARAVEVDLGEKGVWYRVVLGEFPNVDSARAFRAELEAKKTPGMGFVYEMRGR